MKKVNTSGKLKIISRMINKLTLLKEQINTPQNSVELTGWEIDTIADLQDDVWKFEQLTDRALYERIGDNFPNNEIIQRNIKSLLA